MKKYIFFFLLISISLTVPAQNRYFDRGVESVILQGLRYLQWGDLERARDNFERATEIDPKNSHAYYYLGATLMQIAHADKDEKIFKQAFDKFEKAIKLNPDKADAYNSWACGLMDLGKEKKKVKAYAGKAELLLKKYEQMGEQTGAYNLACLYSLINKKSESIKWLHTMMKKKYKVKMKLSRSVFDNDPDFDNIRQSDEFIEFLNRSFPDQLPSKFQSL